MCTGGPGGDEFELHQASSQQTHAQLKAVKMNADAALYNIHKLGLEGCLQSEQLVVHVS